MKFGGRLWLNTLLLTTLLYFHIDSQPRWYPPSTGINASGGLMHNLVLMLVLMLFATVLAISGAAMGMYWIEKQIKSRRR